MDRGWCTKEDVMKDLVILSGQRLAEVDDGCIVVGEQPPPPRLFADEDAEIELRFGRAASTQVLGKVSDPGPDLKGITQMLRMVQDYEALDEDTNKGMEVTPNAKIVISKLDPNVKEFVPKWGLSSSDHKLTKTKDNAIVGDAAPLISVAPDDENGSQIKSNNIDIKSRHMEDVKAKEDDDSEETKKQMAKMLKSKINTKINADTFEEKRETNLAIVNLLKLYAKPEPKTREKAKPVKLYTPDFFENCKASDFESNEEDALRGRKGSIEPVTMTLPSEVEIKKVYSLERNTIKENGEKTESRIKENKNNNKILLKSKKDDNSVETTLLTPDMANASLSSNKVIPLLEIHGHETEDKVLTEAISKVNNWLDNKPVVTTSKTLTVKSPPLYLGTMAYKRKDPATCKSPSEILDKKIPKPSSGAYVPSAYADELLEKYKENSKKMEPKLNIWEKLEQDLKKKDKEIKTRRKNAS